MSAITALRPIRAGAFPRTSACIALTRGNVKPLAISGVRMHTNKTNNSNKRSISFSQKQPEDKDVFAAPEAPHIKDLETAWVHPV